MIGVVISYITHEFRRENVVVLLPVCVFLGFMNRSGWTEALCSRKIWWDRSLES